jgi:hypothetical protein
MPETILGEPVGVRRGKITDLVQGEAACGSTSKAPGRAPAASRGQSAGGPVSP